MEHLNINLLINDLALILVLAAIASLVFKLLKQPAGLVLTSPSFPQYRRMRISNFGHRLVLSYCFSPSVWSSVSKNC